MTVLVCIPCLLTGGTEIQTLSLVKALVASGHEVVTVCYFEHSEQMVQRFRQAGAEVMLLSEDGKRPVGTKRVIKHLWKGLRNAVKTYKPDVAHVQYMAPGAIPIILLRLMGVKKIIATVHTSADIYPSLKLLHFLNKHVLTAFQCITLRAEESFFGSFSLYTPDLKLKKHGNHFTIYNCLPDYISVRYTPKCFAPSGIITIGVVSRLERIKGMDLVVPAFAKVHAKYPGTRLLVVGDGSQRKLMEEQVSEAGINDAVEFAGRQPQDSLQGYYDKIDILLMPSRSEGFGLTAIEGMARGCVPVVANTGGLPEVVQDGVNGLLHKPEDTEDIASKAITLIENLPTTQKMSAQVISHVNRFSTNNFIESFKNLYHKLK